MTRRRKDPFAGKENVRHFRLIQRPLGVEINEEIPFNPSFDEMFEEYDPSVSKHHRQNEYEEEEVLEEENVEDSYDFDNDNDGELVDIDAELDQFAEDFIDIEGESRVDRVKKYLSEGEAGGEAAKYGILLDDRDYDYTKHLRLVGVTPGAVFIQAPGTKKVEPSDKTSKTRDFFTPVESQTLQESNEEPYTESSIPEDVLKANHEEARQQFRSLLQQVGDDPILREVIEALEDDRYVTGEFDDELVISLDNLNIHDDEEEDGEFFNSEIDILDEDEKFPDFIPSEALRRKMEMIAAHEAQYLDEKGEADEFDAILNEYNSDSEYSYSNDVPTYKKEEFIDIEGDSEHGNIEIDEEAEQVYRYLKEHGRARGTTLYDKKRPDHLPPIHIAIAQYSELRRELAVNNEMIIQKYAQEDEEETLRQIRESEEIISGMVKIIDDPVEMEKRVNIETAKYLLKLSDDNASVSSGPKKIIESLPTKPSPMPSPQESSESESEPEPEDTPKINKGAARSVNESAEEKKARKAQIKAEKREKRVEKNNQRK